MNRMWEIREGYSSDHSYGLKHIEEKAYECGFEDGYKKAMEELEEPSYSERKVTRRY